MHGELDSKPSSNRLLMFEGFFNFLSYLELNNLDKAMGDVLILNSTTNAHKAVEYISNHTNVEAILITTKQAGNVFPACKNLVPAAVSGMHLDCMPSIMI